MQERASYPRLAEANESLAAPSPFSWPAAGLGLAITIAVLAGLGTLAAAILLWALGTWSPSVRTVVTVAALFTLLGLFVAFLTGSHLSLRCQPGARRSHWRWHALGTWAVTLALMTAALLYAAGSLTQTVSTALSNAGLAAGAATGAAATLDELLEKRISIVSDLKILDGKVVSYLSLPPGGGGNILRDTTQQAQRDAKTLARQNDVAPKVVEAARDARRTMAWASLFLFATVLFSAAGSFAGAFLARGRAGR